MRRCCFPRAAVLHRSAFCQGNLPLPSPAEFQLLEIYVLPPPHPNPVPKVLSFPQFVWKSRLWCLSSFVCALSLCQLASRGTAKWHPRSLSHSRHVLHLLTHGEWLTNTNMKTILTEQGLDAGGKKNIQENRACSAYAIAFTSSINIYCISYNWVSPV